MALEVLPRLTDAAYDLVFVDAGPPDYPRYLEEAVRLLRGGGIVVFAGALGAGVVDPDASDPSTTGVREVSRMIRADDRLVPVLLPLGDGLLVALKPPA
jgi:predicted O-methyltransferase YrrM